ncbi:MAG: hypothetical protein VB108_10970 [Anaerolineaceae bacterium]|nr:hypothetical protein [Anaerolineaceae bacterium]
MPDKVNYEKLINTTSDAFNAAPAEAGGPTQQEAPKMVNNRQSVFRVPLDMIQPDRFQARLLLPLALRDDFYQGRMAWPAAVEAWFGLAEKDWLIKRELEELVALGASLSDIGQIKPVTGQLLNLGGRDVFQLLTGERRFWATAIQASRNPKQTEPFVLALVDNQPTLAKQIAENMAYKALTPVGKARAAARIVLEANGLKPLPGMDESEYYRQVAELRLDEGTRESLQKTLGLDRIYYGRLMKFFDLPAPLLELADRAEMPERVLREVVAYDSGFWPGALAYYTEHEGRTYLDVHTWLETQLGRVQARSPRLPKDPATKSARALRRVMLNLDELPEADKIGALADAIISESDKVEAAKIGAGLSALQAALQQRLEGLKP